MQGEKPIRIGAGVALLAMFGASGCVTTHAYEVHLDASRAANHELCTTRVDAFGQGKTECEKLAGQSLDAPGTLSVKVLHATPEDKYELRIEQNVRSSEGPAADLVLSEVLARVQQLATGYVAGLDPQAPATDSSLSVKNVFDEVSKNLDSARPKLAKSIRDLSVPAAPPLKPSLDPKKAFRFWIEKPANGAGPSGKFKDLKPAFDSPDDQVFGSPSAFYVPVRLVDFDADLVRYLTDEQHISGEQLADFTTSWCDPASFGKNPYDGAPWENFALEKFVDQKSVLDALGLGKDAVKQAIAGEKVPALQSTIERLLQDAHNAELAHQPVTGAARVAHALHAGAAIHRDMLHCSKNLNFLLSDAAAAKRATTIKATLTKVDALEQGTKPAADTFRTFLAPLLEKTLISYLQESGGAGDERGFGTFSLRSGKLGLGLTHGEGSTRATLAELDFKVEESSPVAVAVGPVVMLCDSCVSNVAERTSLGVDAATGQPILRRQLAESRSSAGIGYAVMVHYSLLRRGSHHAGLSLGYPLRDQSGTAFSLLFGPSYRNTLGFQLSAGLQLFQATRVRSDFKLPLDTSDAATSTLTPGDVSEKTVKAAAFLFAGLSSDSF